MQAAVAFMLLTCCLHASASNNCQETVDAMAALTRDLATPEHLKDPDARKTGNEFNINEYFSVLKHLSPEPGYVLDYVYYYTFNGGEPYLYARKKNTKPHATFQAYIDSMKGETGHLPRHDYLEHVRIDGTEEGFLEFVVLHVMAGQFYLYWHAGYNDFSIICDDTVMEKILAWIEKFKKTLTPDAQTKLRGLKVQPRIEFEGDKARVRVVVFSKWKGFLEDVYTINRVSPHNILGHERKTLVPYDWGLLF